MSSTWGNYRKESFVVVIAILLIFPCPGVLQEFTKEEVEKRDLHCWECDTQETGGTCAGNHEGKSVLCPPEDYPRDNDVDNLEAYRCWIMKVVLEDQKDPEKVDRIEVMKGCSNIAYQFARDSEMEVVPYQDKNGCSNTTLAAFVVGETKRWYRIKMCFCDKSDCNKVEIDGVGQEDIAWRKKVKASRASSLFKGSWHVITLWVVQLVGLAASGLLLGQGM